MLPIELYAAILFYGAASLLFSQQQNNSPQTLHPSLLPNFKLAYAQFVFHETPQHPQQIKPIIVANEQSNENIKSTTTTINENNANPNENDTENLQSPQQSDFVDENWLLKSAFARHDLAKHLFTELAAKNLSDSFNNSSSAAADLASGASAIVSSATESVELNAKQNIASANSLSSQIQSSTLNATSPLQRPYFSEVFWSFQAAVWPIHCVACLAICTLGIFANLTNIIVLTR